MESTVKRLTEAPEDPVVDKYRRMGYGREEIILGLAMHGDKEDKVVEFVRGFTHMKSMGFSSEVIAGALACNPNNMEAAISSCLR